MTRGERTNRQPGLWGVIRKTVIFIVGGALTVVGLVMLVIPGPGVPLVIAGLAVLSPEFPWARRYRDRIRDAGRSFMEGRRSRSNDDGDTA